MRARTFFIATVLVATYSNIVGQPSAQSAAARAQTGQKAAAAARTPSGSSWKVPMTPWGDPDLQGIWSYASLTPLERPVALGDREFFTPEEAAKREQATTEDAPPPPGDPGTYNAHWFDRGKVSPDLRTSLIVDPKNGRLPLTPEGRKRVAEKAEHRRLHPADSWLDRTAWDRCITYHGVPPVSTGYNNVYQILQTPGQVIIHTENIHDVRVIPLDGRPKLPETIRQWNGSSRGRWEGKTLVVETTNYSESTEHRFPSSEHTRAVERFTRAADDRIDYQFTIEDPTLYTQPWTAVRPMPRLTDYVIYEYACHEGNYAMTNILKGERAREAKEGR
ncbi:MAG: hypothetical protein FJW27_02040 [Acidimicrobiia bacterium]|nr:hypothetical protein [Acidimicrobiia bacterium]